MLILTHSVSFSEAKSSTSISKKEFITLSKINTGTKAESKTLWLKTDIQNQIKQILDHPYAKLRLRYLINKQKKQSLWFLDEIGKERAISFAISVVEQRISVMKVLKFRESRGGEIRMQSFTDQFNNITSQDNKVLDQTIDGITGATMSVTAMKKIALLALMLDALVNL